MMWLFTLFMLWFTYEICLRATTTIIIIGFQIDDVARTIHTGSFAKLEVFTAATAAAASRIVSFLKSNRSCLSNVATSSQFIRRRGSDFVDFRAEVVYGFLIVIEYWVTNRCPLFWIVISVAKWWCSITVQLQFQKLVLIGFNFLL